MPATSDIALRYDPLTRRCDVVFNGTDFELDTTPATPMLVALLTKGRARADDPLPSPDGAFERPATLSARGGYCGDALGRGQQRMGSRLWLCEGMKETEATRRFAEAAAAEALAQVETARGVAIQLLVAWVARGVLMVRATAGSTVVSLRRAVVAGAA